MKDVRWYFTRGCYYFSVKTESKTLVFFDDNLDVVNFWVTQISKAKAFYTWL